MRYSLIGKMRLPFIDSNLLYSGALTDSFDCISLLCKDTLWLDDDDVCILLDQHTELELFGY